MFILKAFLLSASAALAFVGILYFTLMQGGSPTPQTYTMIGEVAGVIFGILFPLLSLAFWRKQRRALPSSN